MELDVEGYEGGDEDVDVSVDVGVGVGGDLRCAMISYGLLKREDRREKYR